MVSFRYNRGSARSKWCNKRIQAAALELDDFGNATRTANEVVWGRKHGIGGVSGRNDM